MFKKMRKKRQNRKFLKELSEELLNQEKDYQAAPRFWVLMDYKWSIVPEGYGEEIQIHDCEDGLTEDEFKELIKEYYEDDMIDEGYDPIDYDGDIEYLIDEINDYLESSEFELFHVTKESFIVPNTMFITKKEAKEHIEANHYHYTSEVHTYAMTAWRAPKVAKILSVLESQNY